jgi:hypothetical protein
MQHPQSGDRTCSRSTPDFDTEERGRAADLAVLGLTATSKTVCDSFDIETSLGDRQD